MTKCANCTDNAAFIYEISEAHTIEYCDAHLPRFLTDKKNAGLLKRSEELVQEQSDAFESLSVKSTKKAAAKKAVEETPVVEEVPVEETPATPAE